MADPRKTSLQAAARTTARLGALFDKLGNTQRPRGRIMTAYRSAHRELRDIANRYPAGGTVAMMETRDVMNRLHGETRQIAVANVAAAVELGKAQGNVEAAAWGLRDAAGNVDTAPMVDAWGGVVDTQAKQALATVAVGGDWAYVLGDETRQGYVRPQPAIDEGTKWLVVAAMLALAAMVEAPIAETGEAWGKQAIAAVDMRTTDCCLRVNGQVVPFDGKFHLVGTPRYADDMDWTPFHLYCRTSVAMVPLAMADDDLTARLLAGARRELEKRQTAADRILEIVERLAKMGTTPNARVLASDTDAARELKLELKDLRQRGGYPES